MYRAIIARAYTRPHPNADRLQLANVAGCQVVVGADVQDGELGVFFPTEGQLSKEFCTANDLIARHDESGKKINNGYFDENRRVRAQKFRGARSDGFWVPMEYFQRLGNVVEVASGDALINFFDESLEGLSFHMVIVNGNPIPICNKYITPHTQAARNITVRPTPDVDFPQHGETDHLRYNSRNIPDGALVTITSKLHGTSGRYGNVKVHKELKLSWWQRWINKHWLIFPEIEEYWEHRIGTKSAIITDDYTGYYGTVDFRRKAVRNLVLRPGEIIYFELVGWVDENRPIMDPHTVADKELKKVYQEKITYTYGCEPGQCDLYVYKITQQDVNGRHIELPWYQVKQRCVELGLRHVPEWGAWVYDASQHDILAMADTCVNGSSGQDAIPDPIDPRHILEGVVVRVDSEYGIRRYKHKAWWFGVLEGYIKDNREFVDAEEVS